MYESTLVPGIGESYPGLREIPGYIITLGCTLPASRGNPRYQGIHSWFPFILGVNVYTGYAPA